MTAALSTEQGRRLNDAVGALAVQAEACAALLTDQAGNVLAGTPYGEESTVQAVGALGAGTFSATKELAALTGETAFDSVSHQGSRTGIYVKSLEGLFLLMVIFDKTTTLGLVKLYTDRAIEELAPILREVSGQTIGDAGGSDVKFKMHEALPVFGTL